MGRDVGRIVGRGDGLGEGAGDVVHAACPVNALNWPVGQPTQATAPTKEETVLAGQARQAADAWMGWYHPAAQLPQPDAPSAAAEPAGHMVAAASPVVPHAKPKGHGAQLPPPEEGWRVPTEQLVQLVAPNASRAVLVASAAPAETL